jgi:hypothetical protein
MVSAAIGTAEERLAPAAVVVAFWWLFVCTILLDVVTSGIAREAGVSGQLVGVTLVALAEKFPEIVATICPPGHHHDTETEVVEGLVVAVGVGLGVPWALKALVRASGGGGAETGLDVPLTRWGLVVGSLGVAVATKNARGKKTGAWLCVFWLTVQVAYILLDH